MVSCMAPQLPYSRPRSKPCVPPTGERAMLRSPKFTKLTTATLLAVLTLACTGTDAPTAPSTESARAVSDSSKLFLPIVTPLVQGLVACPRQDYDRTVQ